MLIREMRRGECLRVLAGTRLARLACAHADQPYIVPVYLAYDQPSESLYGFTTFGQKIEWMRANPLVCVEVDEVTDYDQWLSVIAFGRYQEMPATAEAEGEWRHIRERSWPGGTAAGVGNAISKSGAHDASRLHAWQLLRIHPEWQEPGCTVWATRADRDSAEPCTSVFYRIQIDQVTGRKATRDDRDAMARTASALPAARWGWLPGVLTHLFGHGARETGPAS